MLGVVPVVVLSGHGGGGVFRSVVAVTLSICTVPVLNPTTNTCRLLTVINL